MTQLSVAFIFQCNSTSVTVMSGVVCPYHHLRWRSRTQQLLNALRGRLLSHRLVKQFPSIVCVCPEKSRIGSHKAPEGIPELSQWLQTKPSAVSPTVCSILQQCLEAASKLPDDEGTGLVRMVSVVRRGVNGESVELLSSAGQSVPPASSPAVIYRADHWTLDLPSNYLGLLIGRGGSCIKTLCQELGVKILFGERTKSSQEKWHHYHRYSHENSIKVTVIGKKGEVDFKKVRQIIKENADCVIAKRKLHKENVSEYAILRRERQRVKRQQYLRSRTRPFTGVYRDSKEAATDHYERKQQAKQRHPPRKVPHSAISDGHCLNCLLPYSPNHTQQGACTFHPGYLTAVKAGKSNRGYKWTCCSKRTSEHRATVGLHTHTGCSTGRHTWRAGRCGSRKSARENRQPFHADIVVF